MPAYIYDMMLENDETWFIYANSGPAGGPSCMLIPDCALCDV